MLLSSCCCFFSGLRLCLPPPLSFPLLCLSSALKPGPICARRLAIHPLHPPSSVFPLSLSCSYHSTISSSSFLSLPRLSLSVFLYPSLLPCYLISFYSLWNACCWSIRLLLVCVPTRSSQWVKSLGGGRIYSGRVQPLLITPHFFICSPSAKRSNYASPPHPHQKWRDNQKPKLLPLMRQSLSESERKRDILGPPCFAHRG